MFRAPGPQVASTGLLALALLTGCGGKSDHSKSSPETASSEEAAAPAETASSAVADQPTSNPVTAPLTDSDIDRWERGLAAELQGVREAGAKLKTARTSEDTLNAMMGVQEMATVEAGAKAAGLDPERYKFVRSSLSAVVGYLTPSMGGIDTTMLSQAQRDELRQSNEAQIKRMEQEVPPEVVAALKPRAVELRRKDLELVGARLKGVGAH
jgi:hypothetical protein